MGVNEQEVVEMFSTEIFAAVLGNMDDLKSSINLVELVSPESQQIKKFSPDIALQKEYFSSNSRPS
jgi:hypothetical protein